MPIERLDLDGHQEHRRRRRRPQHLDDAFGLLAQISGVGAVGAVHADAAAAGNEPQDVVTGNRGAALGQLGQHARRPRHRDAGVLQIALTHRNGGRRDPFGQFVLGVVGPAEQREQSLHDVPR